ncbi:Radical SAM domain protein CAC_2422 [Olavius sp. associated proteobacterium Delta 1]|nr:Radical SAM domain protein CAC_2422 [Olavius sp. associated proteobacterium Delta 1]
METLPFELGPIRPVDEADSLLIRTTRGCPWNKCEFCVNYKTMRYSRRSVEDIKKDIMAAAEYYGGHPFHSCFLQDGDSFIMKTGELLEILGFLKQHFPSLKRVSSYGRSQTMIRKSPGEIKAICDAGLNLLYCGMESGADTVLKKIKKGVTSADHIKAAQMARQAGMEISQFIILGLGGKALWQEHALETARVLNQINPDFIRVLTIGVKKGSGLEKQLREGKFQLQTEKNLIEEQRLLIDRLDGITSYYVNHHGVDLLMEARGQLPADKPKLLAIMDRYLSMPQEDRIHYTLGKRLGYYRQMDDMQDANRKLFVQGKVSEILNAYPGQFDEICHQLRAQVV